MDDDRKDWETLWDFCFRDLQLWNVLVKEDRWNFSNLEDAFEEGGIWEDAFEEGRMSDGKKLYIFTHVEVLFPEFNDPLEQAYIPVFIVIESQFRPSNKIAFKSPQTGEYEEIVEMHRSGIRWIHFWNHTHRRGYIRTLSSLSNIDARLYPPELMNPKTFYQRLAREHGHTSGRPGSDDINHCTPYFYNPFKVDTTVDIVYQTQAEAEPLHFEYHWEEEPEIFTDALITFNLLPAAHRDSFQELLKERGEEGRRAYQEALPAQEELRAEWIDADDFENMRFYKFYPVATDDTPDISSVKTRFINRYYGDADFLF